MLEAVKLYLRVDGDMEDELISSMIDAAVEYIKSASGKNKLADGRDISESPLVVTAVKMIVSHWYDNRGVDYLSGNFKNVTKIGLAFETILAHITTSEDYVP